MTAVRRLLSYFVLAFAPLSAHASTTLVYVTNSAGDSRFDVDVRTDIV